MAELDDYNPLEHIRLNVEYDLDNWFKPYVGEVDFTITFNNRYQGECIFKNVPEEVKAEINEMLQENIWRFNEYLDEQDRLETEEKQEKLNKERSEMYDVIILLDVHGSYRVELNEDIISCKIDPLDGKYVTFLQASPCGVTNYSPIGWYDIARDIFERNFSTFGPTKSLATFLQSVFRKERVKFIKTSSMIKRDLKTEDAPHARAFMRAPGWDIITSNVHYGDRSYTIDADMLSIVVVYSEHEDTIPVNSNLQSFILNAGKKNKINRTLLLEYLFEQGAKHPLIIDNSCGDVYGTEREKRSIVKDAKTKGIGGTRRKKNKYKRTKRFRK
jgi:hypothetical protein